MEKKHLYYKFSP